MLVKEGNRLVILNSLPGYLEKMGELTEGVILTTTEVGKPKNNQVFVKSMEELDALVPRLKPRLAKNNIVWINYPKESSGQKTDINRDFFSPG